MRKPVKVLTAHRPRITAEIKGLHIGKISELSGKNSCKIGKRENYILLRQTDEFSQGMYIITLKLIEAKVQMLQVLQLCQ